MNLTFEQTLNLMDTFIDKGDYDNFIAAEAFFYNNFIKKIETPDHYLACYERLQPRVQRYGNILSRMTRRSVGRPDKICFFLPSLDNDLAHIEQLYYLLSEHDSSVGGSIIVAGFSATSKTVASVYLRRLAQAGKITLLPITGHQGVVRLLEVLRVSGTGLLVSYSIPTILGALAAAFGYDRTVWMPTKFPLPIYPEVKHRICGTSPVALKGDNSTSLVWHQISSCSIPESSIPDFKENGRTRLRLVSINREEKIAHPVFLESVAAVLSECPQASFAWTGRSEHAVIKNFFISKGLSHRTMFLGWVDPSSVISDYDIFLDTFGLSGTVATRAFSAGMPTCIFRGSRSWVEVYEKSMARDFGHSFINQLLCESKENYVSQAIELVSSQEKYLARADLQRKIAKNYFFDFKKHNREHMSVFRKIADGFSN